jgi:hypothetical protein
VGQVRLRRERSQVIAQQKNLQVENHQQSHKVPLLRLTRMEQISFHRKRNEGSAEVKFRVE